MIRMIFEHFSLIVIIFLPIALIIFYESLYMEHTDSSSTQQKLNDLKQKINSKNQAFQIKFTQIVNKIQNREDAVKFNTWRNNFLAKSFDNPTIDTKNIKIITFFLPQSMSHMNETLMNILIQQLDLLKQLFNLKINFRSDNLNAYLQNSKQDNTLIEIKTFKWQYIQQNIAKRLKSGQYKYETYVKDIFKHLKTLPFLSECHYTNLSCTQTTIVFIDHQSHTQKTYWTSDSKIYLVDKKDPQIVFNILLDIFGLKQGAQLMQKYEKETIRQIYQLFSQELYVKQTLHLLQYLCTTLKPSNFSINQLINLIQSQPKQALSYLMNGKFLTPYIHNKQQIQMIQEYFLTVDQRMRNKTSKILFDPFRDNRIGNIDLFPTQFKFGVYLPLLVIFSYPLFLKIAEILKKVLSNLIKLLKFKPNQQAQQQTNRKDQ